MAKLTIFFGVLLIVIGAVGYFGTGSMFPMSLIPAGIGLVMAISGGLALTDNAKKRMLWMHIAVTVGLIGFIGGAVRFAQSLKIGLAAETEETAAMAFLCLIFVILCVRSFIAARRSRIQ